MCLFVTEKVLLIFIVGFLCRVGHIVTNKSILYIVLIVIYMERRKIKV